MTPTDAHLRLLEELRSAAIQAWSAVALAACLTRLASGGPTDGQVIRVHDAWPLEAEDGICVVYRHPGQRPVGVRVLRTSSPDHPLYLNAHGGANVDDPESFARTGAAGVA